MTAITIQLSDTLYKKLQQAAQYRQATEAEMAKSVIQDFLEQNNAASSIIGLFSDQPELMDQVVADAMRARKTDRLRIEE